MSCCCCFFRRGFPASSSEPAAAAAAAAAAAPGLPVLPWPLLIRPFGRLLPPSFIQLIGDVGLPQHVVGVDGHRRFSGLGDQQETKASGKEKWRRKPVHNEAWAQLLTHVAARLSAFTVLGLTGLVADVKVKGSRRQYCTDDEMKDT